MNNFRKHLFMKNLLRRHSKKERIAIFGAYKTGTTAIFTAVRNALPPETITYFEPTSYDGNPARHQLAKVIVGQDMNYIPFLEFEKHVFIVRDPRDWLSGVLYLAQELKLLYSNPSNVQQVIALLHKKEENPRTIPFYELYNLVLKLSGTPPPKKHIENVLKPMIDFQSLLKADYYQIRYEDFIDGNILGLQAYLGRSISSQVEVDSTFDQVTRTKSYGNWRNWFTPQDVDYFRDVFTDYMQAFDYANEWQLNSDPIILPQHSSEYVQRIVQKRLAKRELLNE